MTSPPVALSKDLVVVTFVSPMFSIFDATMHFEVLGIAVTLQFQFSVQVRVALPVVLEMALTMVK